MVKNIPLPDYTRKEELINSVSHIAGAVFGLFALIYCIAVSLRNQNSTALITGIVYGLSMMLLFSMSGVYHGLKESDTKRIFRVIDHCSVFVFICGSFTPVLMSELRNIYPTRNYILLSVVWILCIVGIILNAANFLKFKNISIIFYVAIGWLIIFEFSPLYRHYGSGAAWLLLGGGILYSVGTILYNVGKKKRYFHSVFHFFVLAGSVLHFLTVALYLL